MIKYIKSFSIFLLTFIGIHTKLMAQTNIFPATGNVGVGTTSPDAILAVKSASGIELSLTESSETINPAAIIFKKSRGTVATPTQALLNDRLMGFYSEGYTSAGAWSANVGAIQVQAAENFTATAQGTYMNFATTPTGSINRVERIRIDSAGRVGIGTTVPGGATDAQLSVRMNTATHNSNTIAYLMSLNRVNSDTAAWYFGSETTGAAPFNSILAANNSNIKVGYDLSGTFTPVLFVGGFNDDGYAGRIGIGTTTPSQKLSVNGTIRAKEVIVDTGWSDYVFAPDYKLASLSEVETQIKANGHLPGIPSAKEVAEHGVSMGEMQAKLLAKIEELTLHVIEQEKMLKKQQLEILELRANAK